jgi:hypothetical protein
MRAVFRDVAPCSLVKFTKLLSWRWMQHFHPKSLYQTARRHIRSSKHESPLSRIFIPDFSCQKWRKQKDVSRQGPCMSLDSSPGPSKCEGLLSTHPGKLNKDSRRKWRNEDRRRRGTKDRRAHFVSDDTDGCHYECWCIYCDYYYTAQQTGSVRHAITILQFPNELSTEQDKICVTSVQDPQPASPTPSRLRSPLR